MSQDFSYYFCLVIEGSGFGSIPLTNGSGSRRFKNMWIRIFLGLLDPDPLVSGMDPDPDPSITKQK